MYNLVDCFKVNTLKEQSLMKTSRKHLSPSLSHLRTSLSPQTSPLLWFYYHNEIFSFSSTLSSGLTEILRLLVTLLCLLSGFNSNSFRNVLKPAYALYHWLMNVGLGSLGSITNNAADNPFVCVSGAAFLLSMCLG